MNILLISQCTKNALERTRQILDQFAERRGERTWQTAITQQGLDTLRRLLRQSARKNTAVACHWIRGKDHSELLWIVGDTRQFNERGAVPTNLTRRNILRSQDENDWHSAETIRLLASIAALFHDFGKANAAFQAKLKSAKPLADAYRHEWVSLRLFEAFVAGEADENWLNRLTQLPESTTEDCLQELIADGLNKADNDYPFDALPPLAKAIGWLIVSHHRLPIPLEPTKERKLQQLNSDDRQDIPEMIRASWCGERLDSELKEIKACWKFDKGLPFDSQQWRKRAKHRAQELLRHLSKIPCTAPKQAYVLHHARLALMLADHFYSSQNSNPLLGDKVTKNNALYANTDRKTSALNQRLDEHLIGVEINTSRIIRAFPRLREQFPGLTHSGFRKRSPSRFAWQNKASDLAEGLRARSEEQGFFGINMASTGSGKTMANARILYGLSNPRHKGARLTVAMGLRSLTLQTGDAYGERLELKKRYDLMAVMVGGKAARELHEHRKAKNQGESSGSESSDPLMPEHSPVFYEGNGEDGPLSRWLEQSPAANKMLNAPLLVCTIDHLMPACESTRGGHQIPPMLRLMTSDLVLDEPDDFGIDDLPALSRLVHWAGLLGSRVLLSSATLPPALVEGLFEAYRAGRAEFAQHRGRPQKSAQICCAWFDEFAAEPSDCGDISSYRKAHTAFVEKRLARLNKAPIRRKAEILPLNIAQANREQVCAKLAQALQAAITRLHADNGQTDQISGKRVSIGLIRIANIDPLIELAKALVTQGAENGQHIHLCVYHSRHPLLIRANIEERLDKLLQRQHDQGQPDPIFTNPELRRLLATHPEQDQIFIVLATAVAEVGRDHDYDWAIVEPSSMRSIIQLAGRIRRHRPEAFDQTNLRLLDYNIKHLVGGANPPVFLRPGFEEETDKRYQLNKHRLSEILSREQLARIDAACRIQERTNPLPKDNLVDLEHARLRGLMEERTDGNKPSDTPTPTWWRTPIHLTGYLQKVQRFRKDERGRQLYAVLPNEDGKLEVVAVEDIGRPTVVSSADPDSQERAGSVRFAQAPEGKGITFWGDHDYLSAIQKLADEKEMELRECALQFGALDLPIQGKAQKGEVIHEDWAYCHQLGFWRWR